VAIIGAGPSGLLLSHLLSLRGVDSVLLERRTREYVEQRVRAGLLEQGTVDLLRESGLAERLDREGLVHEGFLLRFDGSEHRLPFTELTGWTTCMYGQQEVVKDLIRAREAAGGQIYFGVEDATPLAVDTDAPRVHCTIEGEPVEIVGDFVAGCDGFHGVCRRSIPPRGSTTYEHAYPFAWLGILATVAPSSEELIYAVHERGFALHSMRSPELTRLYLQVAPDEEIGNWSDDRIWDELERRFETDDGFVLKRGPIVQKGITPMHSFVVEPMQHGNLFLAGDAAHIVPPTGAKGLNLAIADVRVLARALGEFYASGSRAALDRYSQTCLRRVWKVQRFSWWMTSMLHRFDDANAFDQRRQLAELEYVVGSHAASQSLAENYVGLPMD